MRDLFGPPLLLLAVAALAACSGDGGEHDNLLRNSGFETGAEPWFALEEGAGFEVTSELAHAGSASAVLRMDDAADADGTKVYYLVQEIEPGEMPEVVEGFYRVENWQRGAERQYVQFVIAAIGPDNLTEFPNYQLRYILAGQDRPPFEIRNAHFVFVDRDEPAEGEWVRFSLDVRDDFETYWGAAPEGFERLRLLFEVRWDDKEAGSGAPRGDVYYDDLYAGARRD